MNKNTAFITAHGMGNTPKDYANEIKSTLSRRLKQDAGKVHFGSIYYQDILQPNEERVWNALKPSLRWQDFREFILYGFADATGLEASKDGPSSPYTQAQVKIAQALLTAHGEVGDEGSLVILAQSLGCQVISNFFWDAQKVGQNPGPAHGIWEDIQGFASVISGRPSLQESEIAFLRGQSLKTLVTTGCNIPIFVAAHARNRILPIRPNAQFQWHNYYDVDDVLGWPLAKLSSEYAAVVKDFPINAGGGFAGWLAKSWNPLAHEQYWTDDDVLDPLEECLRRCIGAQVTPS